MIPVLELPRQWTFLFTQVRSEENINQQLSETCFPSSGAAANRPHGVSSLLGFPPVASDTGLPCLPPVPSTSPGSVPGEALQSYRLPLEGRCLEQRDLSSCPGFCANWHARQEAGNECASEGKRERKKRGKGIPPSKPATTPLTLVSACDAINLCQMAELSSNVYVYECVRVCVILSGGMLGVIGLFCFSFFAKILQDTCERGEDIRGSTPVPPSSMDVSLILSARVCLPSSLGGPCSAPP